MTHNRNYNCLGIAAVDSFRHLKQEGDEVWTPSEDECNNAQLDHAVAIIGYGVAANGIPYYLIQNSYGPQWGENGYARITRMRICGIGETVHALL